MGSATNVIISRAILYTSPACALERTVPGHQQAQLCCLNKLGIGQSQIMFNIFDLSILFKMADEISLIHAALRQLIVAIVMQANIPSWCWGTAVQSYVKPRLPGTCLTCNIASAFQYPWKCHHRRLVRLQRNVVFTNFSVLVCAKFCCDRIDMRGMYACILFIISEIGLKCI